MSNQVGTLGQTRGREAPGRGVECPVTRGCAACPPNGAAHTIRGNDPPEEGESAFPSSGVTIVSGEVAGSDPPAYVLVAKNRMRNDLDIYWDQTGSGIGFRDNRCPT